MTAKSEIPRPNLSISLGRIERAIDLVEIKDLLCRERYYRDTNNWQALRNAWHPVASRTNIDISWYKGEIDGFVSGSERMAAEGIRGKHDISPAEIHFNAPRTKAFSESVGRLRMLVTIVDIDCEITAYVRFVSRLEKYEEQWFMISFEAIYESDKLTPTFPTTSIPLTPPYSKLRKSYANTGWALQEAGFVIDQSLAGTDKPETVKALMDKHFSWLRSDQLDSKL